MVQIRLVGELAESQIESSKLSHEIQITKTQLQVAQDKLTAAIPTSQPKTQPTAVAKGV